MAPAADTLTSHTGLITTQMLSRLIEFSLTQRLLVLVATLLLIGAGVTAWNGLPIDAFPDVSTTQVKLIIKAPGMTP